MEFLKATANRIMNKDMTRDLILRNIKNLIFKNLNDLKDLSKDEIINQRKNKFLSIGRSGGFVRQSTDEGSLSMKTSFVTDIKKRIYTLKKELIIFGFLAFLFFIFYYFL